MTSFWYENLFTHTAVSWGVMQKEMEKNIIVLIPISSYVSVVKKKILRIPNVQKISFCIH